jgi:glycerol-3-phosphate acyltransferase PlsY
VVTLMLDALKGALAVLLARWFAADDFGINWLAAGASIAALLGHCFPVWLRFRGGKGVATGVGVFLSLYPLAVACAAAIFILTVIMTRYVSLGSILSVAAFPVFVWLLSIYVKPITDLAPVLTAAIAAGALIILMHHANIVRLVRGTESKFK